MSSFKGFGHAALAFIYVCCSVSPALADDSEIYLGGTSGTSGSPNVLMLIDTSGSMKFGMKSTSSDTAAVADQRMTHLKAAVEKVLTTLPGNIRVGLARYNDDSNGGRIIYPLSRLDSLAGADANGFFTASFSLASGAEDVAQTNLSNAATMITDSAALTIGGSVGDTLTMIAKSDGAVECNDVNAPAVYLASATSGAVTKGLYLNNHPVVNGTSYCESSLGLRFSGFSIPLLTNIIGAKLVMTHAGTTSTAPTGSTWGKSSGDEVKVKITAENTLAPVTYTTASGTVKSRNYVATPSVTKTIGDDAFISSNELLEIDVTDLIKNRKTATDNALTPLTAVALRLEGLSGNGAVTTQQVCTGGWWNPSCSNVTTHAPLIRRIYGPQDDAAKAPRLVLTIAATGDAGSNVGLRFQGLNLPQGAIINDAYLEMTAAADSAGTSGLSVRSDSTVASYINSLPFDATNHLGSARWGTTTATPSLTAWVADQTYKVGITSLVQAQVNSANYCGGSVNAGNQAMGFRLQLASGSVRTVYSYEGNGDKAPRLVVKYGMPTASTCIQNANASSGSGTSSNYAVQSGTGNNALGGNNGDKNRIQLNKAVVAATDCSTNCAVLRFPAIDIPRSAKISKVILKLGSSNNTAGTVTIKGINTSDVGTFTTSNKVSGMTLYSESATWAIPANNSGKSVETAGTTATNLALLIEKIVAHASWVRGNSLGLVLGNNAASGPEFYTTGKASAYPQLTIIYKSNDVADAGYTARQDLIKVANALTANGGTPLNESYYETALYMLGETARYGRGYGTFNTTVHTASSSSSVTLPERADAQPAMNASNVYQSPVGEASCQSNNIVMLTDGEPSSDFDPVTKGTCSKPASYPLISSGSDSFACMAETAKYLAETGRGTNGKIKTYTIGFGPVSNSVLASEGLADVAKEGQGEYFPATDADSLATTFQSIFARVSDSNGTMAAPGVAVSQLNRSEHLDQLYYGVFKPKAQKRWPGNIKRYRLGANDKIVDSTGASAIDSETKYFSVNARSWWSSVVDGNEAAEGGAAEKQSSALTVYTDTGAKGAMPLLDAANPPAAMGTGSSGSPNTNVKWIQGYDVDSENAQGPNGFRQSMGAPIHPQPTLVSYGSTNETFAIFVSTNDGLLHSINNSDGSHNWAYLPQALQSRVTDLRQNEGMSVGDTPLYGLDGSWTPVTLIDGTRLLVGGMRQGGVNYYAVKLPTAKNGAPSLQWILKGEGASPELDGAKTWSQPVYGRIRIGAALKEVFVFGGGMDESVYEAGANASSAGNDKGAALYIVDANNGTVLKKLKTSDMKYSVTASPRLVDKDGDTVIDHIYFGDLGGQIFRVDLNNANSDANTLVAGTSLVAQLGVSAGTTSKAVDRRFYETPAVSYVKDTDGLIYAAVAIGSGDRNFPKSNKDTQDRFYIIRDYAAGKFGVATTSPKYTHDNLDNLSSLNATVNATKAGWYMNMPRTGEKVLSSPFIFSRQEKDANGKNYLVYEVYFNSFVPDASTASGCSPVAGATSAWTINLFDGSPSKNRDSDPTITSADRYQDSVVNGISGSDVGLVRGGSLKRITGTASDNAGKLPGGLNIYNRTRWFDNPNATN